MQNQHNQNIQPERRQGRDWLFYTMAVCNLAGWCVFVICLLLLHFARPELETGLSRFLEVQTRAEWDFILLKWLLFSLVVCVLLSLSSALIRNRRARRRTDGNWINVFVLLAMASIGLASIFIAFPQA